MARDLDQEVRIADPGAAGEASLMDDLASCPHGGERVCRALGRRLARVIQRDDVQALRAEAIDDEHLVALAPLHQELH
jgi:hypothetical protein